ncbi:aspartyl/asparaginyl beta-hydroxylase domain-containing protein [Nocardia sp. CY41]|uniref:aspartyl/asparaginyl beta-hydroxylase domain-containing protein n=1 Tax=Nocardia sp. CY41 TaxID=2608686 RepID=UPI0019150D88|nr:aspartyl/asparaginyl beta-hydroxylase domain-containing protein [Nocardia sp. CY41]
MNTQPVNTGSESAGGVLSGKANAGGSVEAGSRAVDPAVDLQNIFNNAPINSEELDMNILIPVAEKVFSRIEAGFRRASVPGDHTFFDTDEFPWVRRIEDEWLLIRTELDRVLMDRDHLPNFQDISVDQEILTNDDKWKSYFFYGYGFRSDVNCARCPNTARIVSQIPGMKTAFFSILLPDKHLPAHRGPYSGVLRYHLGLRIPEPGDGCRLRVDKDIRHWEEGSSLIFDDTYDHEAWNDTSHVRVVLFVDFVRPMRFPMNFLNRAILYVIKFTPFVTDARRRELDWEKRYAMSRTQANEY